MHKTQISASAFFILCFVFFTTACSSGGGGGDSSNGPANPSGPEKPGACTTDRNCLEQACSDAQKIAGLCLFTLNMDNNPELKRCIEDYASDNERGWHLISQMSSLSCPADTYTIEQLNGIEQLTELKVLSVNGTESQPGHLSDMEALGNLTDLKELYLNYQQFGSIPDLSALPRLTTLSLAGNAITDASPLTNYPSIEQLDLSNNNLSSPDPIFKLPNLTGVNLEENTGLECDSMNAVNDQTVTIKKPAHCGCLIGTSTLGGCTI